MATLRFVMGFDSSFEREETRWIEEYGGQLEKVIRLCGMLAKPRKGSWFRRARPAKCPDLDPAAFEDNNLAVDIISGGRLDNVKPHAGREGWFQGGQGNTDFDFDMMAIEGAIQTLRTANDNRTAVLLTKRTIHSITSPSGESAGRANAGEDSIFLINVRAGGRYVFPHELGHKLDWKSEDGEVHSRDWKNLMSTGGSRRPDCLYARLLLGAAV